MADIKRGNIFYADLGAEYQGSMQGGIRPVVVISNNKANRYSTVLTVVPLSSKISKKQDLPVHVLVPSRKIRGLVQDSVALCEQVTALDSRQIIEYIGTVDAETLLRITEAVQVQVGVFGQYN